MKEYSVCFEKNNMKHEFAVETKKEAIEVAQLNFKQLKSPIYIQKLNSSSEYETVLTAVNYFNSMVLL